MTDLTQDPKPGNAAEIPEPQVKLSDKIQQNAEAAFDATGTCIEEAIANLERLQDELQGIDDDNEDVEEAAYDLSDQVSFVIEHLEQARDRMPKL